MKRLSHVTFSIGIFGFAFNLLLVGLTIFLIIGNSDNQERNDLINFSGGGPAFYGDMLSRYIVIAFSFVLYIVFVRMFDNFFLKVAGLIPLAAATAQSLILIESKPVTLRIGAWKNSTWLDLVWYFDFCILPLAVILLILHLYLIWLIYRSSIHSNP